MKGKRLRRSKKNRILAGVMGGIAEFFDVDPTIVRVLFVISIWTGLPVAIYVLLAIIMPEEQSPPRNDHSSYHSTRYYHSTNRPRKEARKVEKDEEWSDF